MTSASHSPFGIPHSAFVSARATWHVPGARAAVVLLLAVLVLGAGCRERREPIRVERGTLIVENQTSQDWTDLEVWLNDHYRVTTRRLEAGGQFVIPLRTFVAGFGQRFDPQRQHVEGVEVTAAAADGEPVRLVYGTGRRR
jgi:hypothetical protein